MSTNYVLDNESSNDDTIYTIIIIVIIAAIVWFVFINPTADKFDNTLNNPLYNPAVRPTMLDNPAVRPSIMSNPAATPSIISDSMLNQNGMVPFNSNDNSGSMMAPRDPNSLRAELSNVQDYSDSNQDIESNIEINKMPQNMTADDRTVYDMNMVNTRYVNSANSANSAKPNYNISSASGGFGCNLLGIDVNKLSNYKKKYYSMYKHQVECPKNCYMNRLGMKKCGLDNDSDCGGVFTSDYNNSDVFALGYLAVDKNNSKSCVSCTLNRGTNNLNRSSIAEDVSVFDSTPLKGYGKEGFGNINRNNLNFDAYQSYEDLPDEVRQQDEARMFKRNVADANISNYVDFENNVYLNSIGETSVDKMAEIRTCASGTCGLKDYGKSINNVYDKLLNTPAYTNRASCNPNAITGVLEDAASTDNYRMV